MNCCKCGKSLAAGMALCLHCEKDLARVPDETIRLGYYARHPYALAALLLTLSSGEDDLGLAVCRQDCVSDPETEADCTDEKYTACIVRWLLEPMGGQNDEHV